MKNIDTITVAIKKMYGKTCWFANSSSVPGTFSLAIGEKKLRKKTLKKCFPESDFNEYEGEFNLYVWCTWRIDFKDSVVTSSDDTCESISLGLSKVVGAIIDSIEIAPPGMDLAILFNNEYKIKIFCDHVPGNPSFDGNWDLFSCNYNVFAGPGEKIEFKENFTSL